ncbi:MbcA/ParS/Xre antitoxin family protein [Coralloluteibacterium stylophorae]|uniref:DUF2384 domain-containing protein n=1 Tax=Coralloluteibacterium stylophorae TaxID=1776034 RepID=A0A8J8AXL8_9GAMM|nr:MbcA/ParS/Xre antitoxin family protein [Coralloluteibacterium stylophorae]MBS7457408.1 DUF2384 domain-containing protein [Coralloluteibacterium stylophorae]
MAARTTATATATATARPDPLGPAGLRALFAIAERWGLKSQQVRRLLGDPPESTFFKWKKTRDASLGRDTLERISYVLGIFKALEILFPDPTRADAWVHRPNAAPPFNGQSALERMLSGNVADLYVVRSYLDAQRGW